MHELSARLHTWTQRCNAACLPAFECWCLVCCCAPRSLYVNVITTIRGFGDFFWVDVVEQIDTMTEQVNNFQNQAKKLPKVGRYTMSDA